MILGWLTLLAFFAVPMLAITSIVMIARSLSISATWLHVTWALAIAVSIFAIALNAQYPKDQAILGQFAQLWALFLLPAALARTSAIVLRGHGAGNNTAIWSRCKA